MNEPAGGPDTPAQKSDARAALLGVACGAGAALFWALGFVATRHGLKVGFTPADLLMHRFVWSGVVFLPLVLRAGIGNLGSIGWGRGLVLMVLGGPVMSLISYTGFLFVPLGHGSVIQPSSATLGGLLLAAVFCASGFAVARGGGGRHRRRSRGDRGGVDRPYRSRRRARRSAVRDDRIHVRGVRHAAAALARQRLLGGHRHQRAVARTAAALCGLRRVRPRRGARPR